MTPFDSTLLAHYTRAETALDFILPSGVLRMNLWDQMNDPFEYQKQSFVSGGAVGDVPDFDHRMYAADMEVEKIRSRTRLACFTQASETAAREWSSGWLLSFAHARPRMWAQYADNHCGVCLLLDRAALQRAADEHQGITFLPVEYTEGGFRDTQGARAPDLGSFTPEQAAEAVFEHSLRYFADFLFVKTLDWQAEHEYRFVLDPDATGFESLPPGKPAYLPIRNSLRYVIVGERFPEELLPGLLAVLADWPDVEVRRMHWTLGIAHPAPVTSSMRRRKQSSSAT